MENARTVAFATHRRRLFRCFSLCSPFRATSNSLGTHNLLTSPFPYRVSGRCGHGSPCEQLCYELHDGMYECDCKDGYILHKNGYSCAGECDSIRSLSRFAIRIHSGRHLLISLIKFCVAPCRRNFLMRRPYCFRSAAPVESLDSWRVLFQEYPSSEDCYYL